MELVFLPACVPGTPARVAGTQGHGCLILAMGAEGGNSLQWQPEVTQGIPGCISSTMLAACRKQASDNSSKCTGADLAVSVHLYCVYLYLLETCFFE